MRGLFSEFYGMYVLGGEMVWWHTPCKKKNALTNKNKSKVSGVK